MPTTISESEAQTRLRDKAEAQLQAGATPASSQGAMGIDALRLLHRLSSNPDHAEDALKLLHELQVHQVELDLQHEEMAANEQALVEDLRLYRTLYDCAPLGYLLVDFEGNILQGNPAAAELLELAREDLEGHSIDTLLLAQSRPRLRDLLQRVGRSGAGEGCLAETGGYARATRLLQFLASLPPGGEHILLACCECASPDSV